MSTEALLLVMRGAQNANIVQTSDMGTINCCVTTYIAGPSYGPWYRCIRCGHAWAVRRVLANLALFRRTTCYHWLQCR